MTTVYLASRYSRQEELQVYAEQLTQRGYRVTSRWLHGNHRLHDNEDVTVRSIQLATEDAEDIAFADVLVHFTEESRAHLTRGGRHFEMGMGYGMRKRVIVVGPREHVFCYLPEVPVYATWLEALEKEFPR